MGGPRKTSNGVLCREQVEAGADLGKGKEFPFYFNCNLTLLQGWCPEMAVLCLHLPRLQKLRAGEVSY